MDKLTISIKKAEYIGDYILEILFDDGSKRTIDFGEFLKQQFNPDLTQFLNTSRFVNFRIEHGDLIWGDYPMCFPLWDLYTGEIIHDRDDSIDKVILDENIHIRTRHFLGKTIELFKIAKSNVLRIQEDKGATFLINQYGELIYKRMDKENSLNLFELGQNEFKREAIKYLST